MPATDLTIKLLPGRARQYALDRQSGHHATMAMLPDRIGPMARSASQTLWHVSQNADELKVRSAVTLSPARIGRVVRAEPMPTFSAGAKLHVVVDVSCVKTPKSDVPEALRKELKQGKAYRSRLVVVPEADRLEWASTRLVRIGLAVASLTVSALDYAQLGKRGGAIPFVTIDADAVVTDAQDFHAALAGGVGKGRNFGLGLIQATSTPSKG